MNSSIELSAFKSRVTRWIALPSLLVLLPNYLAFAAITTCPANFVSDEFASTDYSNLGSTASPPILGVNQLLSGLKSESYTVASNSLITTGSLDAGGSNFYRPKTLAGNLQSFEFFQDFTNKASSRTASYTFKNSFTNESQALTNVSLSIYDIDVNYLGTGTGNGGTTLNTRYFEFSDQVTITGFTSAGTSVTPTLTYRGAGITTTAPYRQTTTTGSVLCSTDSVDERCKVSVTFNQPIVRVDVSYGNNPNLEYYDNTTGTVGNPGDQLINIVFDGYCYLPQPRLTYTKVLSSSRKTNTDQFTVQIKDNADNSVVTSGINSVTTSGSGNTVTTGTGTTGTFKVNPAKTYTLTEAVSGTTNLADYTASYACRRSDGTTVTTLDPKNLKLTYGDSWICTITNDRSNYIFSGTVFNDNGQITSPAKDDVSAKYLNNSLYFNGRYDSPTESGIPFTTGHTITLNKCAGDSGTFSPQTVNINSDGTYSFNLTSAQVGSYTRLCVTQNEPSNYAYSVDTTSDVRQINIINSQYNYPSNDFGDVIQENAALVLIKSQYVHDCSLNNLATIGVNYEGSASSAYSIKPISGIVPGQCIAYRIEAINRGNVSLTDIVIKDTLQSKNDSNNSLITSTLVNPTPIGENSGTPSFATNSVSIGNNGTVTTNTFSLGATTATRRQAIRFNTKYGTTISN
ncbi:hypothetical protein [Psychrobacter sp. Ps6]|uniref:hypothetical protein n=1 Tax=Psychrobacter sp. Ps6 TaxID=2790960 RepID=UPI001EDE4525|nr:hypothetical protein [Psychrobacter sp. Ps6]MCG3878856.1 hypothetical protein [Psychrobacter sp. Ps6]